MFSNRLIANRPLFLGLIVFTFASGVALGQSPSGVIDGAGMFSDDVIRQAKTELTRIDKAQGVNVTVETIDSLKGKPIEEVAIRRAEMMGHKGIFVLIAKRDREVEVLASPRVLLEEIGKLRLHEIRDAFTAEFRKGKVDDGLTKGVQAAEKVLAVVRPASIPTRHAEPGGFLPTTIREGSSSGTSSLVLRQQVRLTLAGARKAIEGAQAKAVKEGWKMNIAVVDDGGHLVAFERMDGARPASVATSTTKAVSAATYRQATGPIAGPAGGSTPDILLNIGLQNASGGKVTTLPGGLPIIVDGQVIGAIGVGGGSGEQDAEVAKAGLAGFLEALEVKSEEARPKPKEAEAPITKPAEGDTSPKF